MAVSQESASQTNPDADTFGSSDSQRFRSSTSSSSSSFSVQSHSGEDDWTRVGGGMNVGGRRRRFTTESSCASHQSDHSQVHNVLISVITYLSICLIYRWFWRWTYANFFFLCFFWNFENTGWGHTFHGGWNEFHYVRYAVQKSLEWDEISRHENTLFVYFVDDAASHMAVQEFSQIYVVQ